MVDYKTIYLIPDDEHNAFWCQDPAPGTDMDPGDAIVYRRVDWVVELEPDVWLSEGEGDPCRTVFLGSAQRFMTENLAHAALMFVRNMYLGKFENAQVYLLRER